MTAGAVGDPLVLTGAGMVASVGHDSEAAPAAIRAGIARFTEVEDCATTSGAAFTGSVVYGLTDGRSGTGRLNCMALPAAREALFRAEEFCEPLDLGASRMILSLPPAERPGYGPYDADDLDTLLEVGEMTGLRPSPEVVRNGLGGGVLPEQSAALHQGATSMPPSVELVADGHAGVVLALERAERLLRETGVKHCIIGAVDSLVELPTLLWLDEKRRAKTDERPAGFVPGEAAAFLVVERRSEALRRGATPLAELHGASYGREPASLDSEKPLRGVGLAGVIERSLFASGATGMPPVMCDLNGEYYRSKEWVLAMGHLLDGESAAPELWHPAECIGDVGAATGGVLLVIAAAALRERWCDGREILVWCSSDGDGRGSVVVRAPEAA